MAAGMLAFAAISAHAATTAYGEAFDTLYRIDLDARTASPVGAAGSYGGVPIGNISGLTTAPDGTLYAISGAFKQLLRVDAASGHASVIGSLALANQGSGQFDALDLNMVASPDGTLYLSSAVANLLWTVDPATGQTTLVGATGHTITGLAARGDQLYGAGGKGDNRFYRIDRSTGAATPIGSFGPSLTHWVNTVSMSFDADGTLWAVLNYVPPEHDNDIPADWSDLAAIDPASGVVTVIAPITGPESLRGVGIKGFSVGPAPAGSVLRAVSAPVDAPWALALLVALLGTAGFCRRRRLPS